ncbi:putative cyclin-F3-2 [Hordeum vulgare]|nr:putative cyclin-F3-2 [Hordeum vulgare]
MDAEASLSTRATPSQAESNCRYVLSYISKMSLRPHPAGEMAFDMAGGGRRRVSWLTAILRCASAKRMELMCIYLAELSLLDYDCIRFLPSVIAAACLFLARFTVSPKTRPWDLTLQENTGYKVSNLKSCILRIHELQLGRQYLNLKAIRSKYNERKFGCVSMMASSEEIPASFLEDLDK